MAAIGRKTDTWGSRFGFIMAAGGILGRPRKLLALPVSPQAKMVVALSSSSICSASIARSDCRF